jgi:hypothetical protein
MSRIDHLTRYSRDPAAIQLCEDAAEEESLPSDEGDLYGWGASLAEDRETRWRDR